MVDALFARHAPPDALSALWSTDDGIGDDESQHLASKLREELSMMPPLPICSGGCKSGFESQCNDGDVVDGILSQDELIGDFPCDQEVDGDFIGAPDSDDGDVDMEDADGRKCTLEDNGSSPSSAWSEWTGWVPAAQRRVARRIASALIRATQRGRSANFKVTESTADQLVRLLTPSSLEALIQALPPAWGSALSILCGFLATAFVSAVVADALILRLLGTKKSKRELLRSVFNVTRRLASSTSARGSSMVVENSYGECSCRLCSGDLRRGDSIGKGGFGEVFLCYMKPGGPNCDASNTPGSPACDPEVVAHSGQPAAGEFSRGSGDSSSLSSGSGDASLTPRKQSSPPRPKCANVVKMIRADFEKDVSVLQDALDEAKNLLSLEHDHIVRYTDVFVHRDVDALKRRYRLRSGSGSDFDSHLGTDQQSAAEKKKPKMKAQSPGSMSGSSSDEGGASHGSDRSADPEDGDDADVKDSECELGCDFICIVMEYCAGGTLLDYVASGVLLPLDVAVNTIRQTVEALAYMHAQGLVHFDMKLENIFLAERSQNQTRLRPTIALDGSQTEVGGPKRRKRNRQARRKRAHRSRSETDELSSTLTGGGVGEKEGMMLDSHHLGDGGGFVVKVGDFGLAVRRANHRRAVGLSPPLASPLNSRGAWAASLFSSKARAAKEENSAAPVVTAADSLSHLGGGGRGGEGLQRSQRLLLGASWSAGTPLCAPLQNGAALSASRQAMSRRRTSAFALSGRTPSDDGGRVSASRRAARSPFNSGVAVERSASDRDNKRDSGDHDASASKSATPESDFLYPDGLMYMCERGVVAGTAPYQPPECFREATDALTLGPEVDVWALGCIIFEAVTCTSLPLEPPYLGQIALKRRQSCSRSPGGSKSARKNGCGASVIGAAGGGGGGRCGSGDGSSSSNSGEPSSQFKRHWAASHGSANAQSEDSDSDEDDYDVSRLLGGHRGSSPRPSQTATNSSDSTRISASLANDTIFNRADSASSDDGRSLEESTDDDSSGCPTLNYNNGDAETTTDDQVWEDVFAGILKTFDEHLESMVTCARSDRSLSPLSHDELRLAFNRLSSAAGQNVGGRAAGSPRMSSPAKLGKGTFSIGGESVGCSHNDGRSDESACFKRGKGRRDKSQNKSCASSSGKGPHNEKVFDEKQEQRCLVLAVRDAGSGLRRLLVSCLQPDPELRPDLVSIVTQLHRLRSLGCGRDSKRQGFDGMFLQDENTPQRLGSNGSSMGAATAVDWAWLATFEHAALRFKNPYRL